MKAAWSLLVFLGSLALSPAATTIDSDHPFAYGANLGWIDWRGDTNQGAVIGEYVCAGYLYAANVGWIHLGNGSPTNGIRYQQLTATDCGVNHDGLGNLRGYAWGANIGWIAFEATGAPTVDLASGRMSGYAYSANLGWINLSNAVAWVQTDVIAPGTDSDHNGLADAWEWLHFARLGVDPNDDPDLDGLSNSEEYLAGTNPTDGADNLRVTACTADPAKSRVSLTWRSQPTRQYRILRTDNLKAPVSWSDVGLGVVLPDPGPSTSRSFPGTGSGNVFYRIEAFRMLSR